MLCMCVCCFVCCVCMTCPPPITGNSCGFASLAGIGMRNGDFSAPQRDQHSSTNTWEFMLFCVRATTCVQRKVATQLWRPITNPFKKKRVGGCWRFLSGSQVASKFVPGTTNITKTLGIHCVSEHVCVTQHNNSHNTSLRSSPNTWN